MEQVFITKSTLKRLTKKINLIEYLEENIPEHERLVKILSKPEKKSLLEYRQLIEDLDCLIKYQRDARTFVSDSKSRWIYYEMKNSSYHLKQDCPHLLSDYINYSIPIEIEDQDIEDYRNFFKSKKEIFDEKPDVFFAMVEIKFNVVIKNIKKVHNDNSGHDEMKNYKLELPDIILTRIDSLITEMEIYRISNKEIENLIKNLGFGTHKARYFNENGESLLHIENESSPIYLWHQYKNKLKYLIENYFISTLNPDFKFNRKILEQCGIDCCRTCMATVKTHMITQVLTHTL